uniref:Ribosomal protein L7Ae/L30e/S12e/Gadd45 domain-containing protein n=1 Tax=Acrobeloides nanus TaxID=290746 RepID=A0A914DQ60_9BILA
MSKKVKISTPKPYIKPNFKLDLHANDNRGKLEVLNLLGGFLIESGFRRKICKKNNKDGVKKDVKEDEDMPSSSVQKDTSNIKLGFRSVLRSIKSSQLAVILFDESLIKPSAVTNIMALFALSSPIKMYAVPEMGKLLGLRLNMPMVSALGLSQECGAIVEKINEAFTPIGLSAKKRLSESSSVFSPPTLVTPVGKSGKKRKKKKIRDSGLLLS